MTGANSGTGFHQALELARKGTHVLLASRDPGRGQAARAAAELGITCAFALTFLVLAITGFGKPE